MKHFHLIVCLLLLLSCTKNTPPVSTESRPLFDLLPSDSTGVQFVNRLIPTNDLNIFTYMYFYNGGGVGVADLNNDQLLDIVFTGNQVENKIYINKGNLKFDELHFPGDSNTGWSNGVNFVDINTDGLLDIYISQVNNGAELKGHHRLFVCEELNNGVPKYKERSKEYGLNFEVFGTQSAFFDFDRDGDLDIYLLNHSVHKNGTFGERRFHTGKFHEKAGDRLLRNDKGKYVDITKTCGIHSNALGYGLGIKVSDSNLDGWPDVYIGNDFHENDYFYINQKNGTFKDELDRHIMHTSRYTMGVDIADFNNDLYPDIFSLDMLPYDYSILKRSEGEDLYNIYLFKLSQGYNQQYSRNTLQLNRKNGFFSEIGTYSGVHATDWSWSTFFADLDNDGWKDIFISNGIPRRMNDIDYIDYVVDDVIQNKIREKKFDESDLELLGKLPEIKIPNKFYKNTHDIKFQDLAGQIKNDKPGFSNGAAYADLDNDGDLEVITNNINDPAFIYKNLSVESGAAKLVHLNLIGDRSNPMAIGAKVYAYSKSGTQYYEKYSETGFQSSIYSPLYITSSSRFPVDSILIVWPDQEYQIIKDIKPHMNIALGSSGTAPFNYSDFYEKGQHPFLWNIIDSGFSHTEYPFHEFDREALMPFMTSTEGPALAVGDINKDGFEDVYLGGSRYYPAQLIIQSNGKWIKSQQPQFLLDSMYEDICAVMHDFTGDGNIDVLVGSGGNEFFNSSEYNLLRLYVNDGFGNFSRKKEAFDISDQITASVIIPFDFNQDNQMDIFIGARSVAWAYGKTPESKILINQNGKFVNQTTQYTKTGHIGLVKDAILYDFDTDGDQDILIAPEWEPLKILINTKNKFELTTLQGPSGLWNCIDTADFDLDGDVDIIAGNFGLNSKFKASDTKPLRMYYADFDKNDRKEQAISYFFNTSEVPFATIKELHKQMPSFKKKFQFAADYASLNFDQVFGDGLKKAIKYEVNELASVIFENRGNGSFHTHQLPMEAEWSTIKDILCIDVDNDGDQDVVPVGNFYECNTQLGRLDADPGIILLNSGGFNFIATTLSTPLFTGQTRRIINSKNKTFVAKNDSKLLILGSNFEKN